MNAQQPARVLSGGARFAPKALRVGNKCLWKVALEENLVAVDVRDRNLRRRYEKEILIAQGIHVVLEFRKLSGRRHRRAVDDYGDPELLVSVFPRVKIDHHVHESADQPRAEPAIQNEPRPGELRPTLEIDQTQLGPNLPMGCCAPLLPRRSPLALNRVRFLAALGNVAERDVWNLEKGARQRRLQGIELALEARDFLTEAARLGKQIVCRLAGFLSSRNFLADAVARGLPFLDGLNERATLGVRRLSAIDDWGRARRAFRGGACLREACQPAPESCAGRAFLLAGNAGSERPEPAVGVHHGLNRDRVRGTSIESTRILV